MAEVTVHQSICDHLMTGGGRQYGRGGGSDVLDGGESHGCHHGITGGCGQAGQCGCSGGVVDGGRAGQWL